MLKKTAGGEGEGGTRAALAMWGFLFLATVAFLVEKREIFQGLHYSRAGLC